MLHFAALLLLPATAVSAAAPSARTSGAMQSVYNWMTENCVSHPIFTWFAAAACAR